MEIFGFFSQKCLLSSLLRFVTFVQISVFNWLKVMYMFMELATSLVVLFDCCATADISEKNFNSAQCFLFLYLGNSQVSAYRTIGPTLVVSYNTIFKHWLYRGGLFEHIVI